jgi:hypothetical protein
MFNVRAAFYYELVVYAYKTAVAVLISKVEI